MKGKIVCLFVLFLLAWVLAFSVMTAKSESVETVFLRADGSVEPSNVPIQVLGDFYLLKDSLKNVTLWVERNSIVIDGQGHSCGLIKLQTIFDVTIQNMMDCYVSITKLGNNTIKNCTGRVSLDYSFGNIIFASLACRRADPAEVS